VQAYVCTPYIYKYNGTCTRPTLAVRLWRLRSRRCRKDRVRGPRRRPSRILHCISQLTNLGGRQQNECTRSLLQVQCRTPLFLLLFLLVSARKAQTTLTRHVAAGGQCQPGVCERGHVTLDLVFDNGAGRAFGLSRFILSALVLDKYKLDACA
jgi:hypothetical protein